MIPSSKHRPGDLVTVRWPDGPHDYMIEFKDAVPFGPGNQSRPDWFLISGRVVQPRGPMEGRQHTFYVHPVNGDPGAYELTPFTRRPVVA